MDPRQKIPLGPGYQVPFSAKIRTQAEITTWTVGMICIERQAEDIITAGGKADIVALARGMMFDPRWAWHAAEELGVDTEYFRVSALRTRAMACGISVARHLKPRQLLNRRCQKILGPTN